MEKILVIDDELETCEMLRDILEKEGYSVNVAVSPREGFEIVKRHHPDLIICDVLMGEIDGVEFLSEFKSLGNGIPIIMMTAYGSQDKVVHALELGANDFIAKPFKPKNIVDTVKKVIKLSNATSKEKDKFLKEELSPMRRLLRDSYMSILKSLAIILESKDPYIKEHSLRVTKYAVMLAKELGLKHEEVEIIENTGYFHDIGKVGISDTILQKPSALNEEEWEHIRKHPQIGHDIVEPLKLLHIALPGIKHHHERYDGEGYPDRLKGEQIPLYARILCIADSYEALTANRPYRKARSQKAAVTELKRCAGSQFDPDLVDKFIRALKKAGEV